MEVLLSVLTTMWLFGLAISIVYLIGLWKMYEKANRPGWAAIIPIYNIIVMLEIVKKPLWWIALFFVPFANIVIAIMMMIELAKAFGKSEGFAVALIFFPYVCIPILGFGGAKYGYDN